MTWPRLLQHSRALARATLLTAALALALPSAPNQAAALAAAPVTLRYFLWDPAQRPLYQQCARQFEARHPGIRIRIQQQGWDDYWTTLSTGFVAETAPDVFTNHLSKFPDLVANGQLVDLAPYIRRDQLDPARYVPGLYSVWGRNGPQGRQQYGLPKDWDTVALLVNLDHAARAGVTLATLRTMDWNPQDGGTFGRIAALLTRDQAGRNALDAGFDKARVTTWGYQNPGPGGMSGQTEWGHFAASNGFTYQPAPWSNDLRYDDPRLADTLAWLASLPARGLSARPEALGKLGVEALFATGRVAMVPAGAWMIGHYARSVRFAHAWVPLPTGPTGQRASMLNSLADSIWIGSQHKEAAWAWVQHLATVECQSLLAASGVVFPALAGLTAPALAAQRRHGVDTQAFVDMQHSHTFAPPITENAAEIDQVIGAAMETILLGRAQAGPTLRKANAQARALGRP